LPLGWQIISNTDGKIVWEWVSFVLKYLGGRKSDAKIHLDAMLEMKKMEDAARAVSEERWLKHDSEWRGLTFRLLDRLVLASRQAVAPVGPSVDTVGFLSGEGPAVTVDVPMADAIRAKGELDVSDLKEMTLRVDGYTHHNKALKIERPDEPGKFMSADVRDPLFESAPNPYTQAAETQKAITVMAKVAYRDARVERIYIMDFLRAA
jgi:hypothetical protein